MRQMRFKFAIVGAGLTGTSMLCQLVQQVRQKMDRKLLDGAAIRVLIFEKQNIFGPGFPHNDRFVMPYHITNMCDHDMGIIDGNPADFRQWVVANHKTLARHFSETDASIPLPIDLNDTCRHFPRAMMGEYLKARFEEALRAAQNLGLRVKLYPGVEVTDLKEDGNRVRLQASRLHTGEDVSQTADRVLLATGHWIEETTRVQYFASPWPARKLLQGIPEGEHVAVIGTSLSAIEAVLTLASDGTFRPDDSGRLVYLPTENPRKMTLYSRRGMLPKVRGRQGAYRNAFLTRENLNQCRKKNNGYLTLETVFDLLNSDLESAYGRPFNWQEIVEPVGSHADLLKKYLADAEIGDGPAGELIWQTVLHQTFTMVREIYLSLTLADRKRFDRDYTTLFFIHAATQPAINAEKLLALIKAGIVRVRRLGENYRLMSKEPDGPFVFSYRDEAGRTQKDRYRYVVNARGQNKSINTNPSVLANNLITSQTILTEEFQFAEPLPAPGVSTPNSPKAKYDAYKTGSVWIDPASHRVMSRSQEGPVQPSHLIYAVGAMTRGQIIDASMAYGIAHSTARIAADLIDTWTSETAFN